MNIYKEEREIQNRIANEYDSVYESLVAYSKRWNTIVDVFSGICTKNDRILEIGCGTGTFLKNLEKVGFNNLMGCDLAELVIDVAKEKVKSANFSVGNMIDLPYENDSFDVVTFMGSLHHLPFNDIKLAIAQASRILRKGGLMVIADANSEMDDFKHYFPVKVIRKLFTLKNTPLRKKLWKFNPDQEENYTEEHIHKSKIDYINFSLRDGSFTYIEEILYEHFVFLFEGCLFSKSTFDRIIYYFLKLLDKFIPLSPKAQLILIFKKL